ncbi:PGF-CTERM sorting domain-containing protein [Natronomonas marina]|jgi:PGF-CTERM protein|uniref:PGF-CTERM sorting domain-containing protein n=1 Tax=Natronomonas marina TaxID=2961939 RepID=UPI0020CA0C4D|nr:PGF-CTERM sorting domain-containing protein [Natronomonas marina]
MERRNKRVSATLLAVVLAVSAVGGVTVLAFAGTVAADQHERENAPTYNTSSGAVNFTINLPTQTDHLPGSQNQQNGSIEYFATGQQAFTEQNAEDGLWMNFIVIEAEWIDYSNCDVTQNTKVFGIDRGNTRSGTRVDEDLIEHRKGSTLEQGGLTVDFYDWGDLGGGPPYLSPDDAVVAAQGVGSNAGPCLTMTSTPGWYQLQGYTNGTIATKCTEEGNSQCEPDNKKWRGINLNSNYVYICDCENEQQAREQLGPPPTESGTPTPTPGGNGATPTPTQAPNTPTPTQAPNTPTPTQAPNTPTPTQVQTTSGGNAGGGNAGGDAGGGGNAGGSGGGDGQATRTQGNAGGDGGGNAGGADRATPTISDGPGFTPVVALVALLAAALLVVRRR